jgi:hypothetical protein
MSGDIPGHFNNIYVNQIIIKNILCSQHNEAPEKKHDYFFTVCPVIDQMRYYVSGVVRPSKIVRFFLKFCLMGTTL